MYDSGRHAKPQLYSRQFHTSHVTASLVLVIGAMCAVRQIAAFVVPESSPRTPALAVLPHRSALHGRQHLFHTPPPLLGSQRELASGCQDLFSVLVHDSLSSQGERDCVYTGLRRWRLRMGRRLAADLPTHERWDCPNQCSRCFRNTSTRSIAKHKHLCSMQAGTGFRLPSHSDLLDAALTQKVSEPITFPAAPTIASSALSSHAPHGLLSRL